MAQLQEERDPLHLLDEMVTALEDPFTGYVDDIHGAYVARGEALEKAAREHQKALDQVATLHKQLEAAQMDAREAHSRADDESRRADENHEKCEMLEQRSEDLDNKLRIFSRRLKKTTNASVGMQVVLDQGTDNLRKLIEMSHFDDVMLVEDYRTRLNSVRSLGSELIRGLRTMELIAERQYAAGDDLLSDAASQEALNNSAIERAKEARELRLLKAAQRVQNYANRRFVWKRQDVDEVDWEVLAERRQAMSTVTWHAAADLIIGTDGGMENLERTQEELEEAARLKKQRTREAAREKMRKQKELKRQKQAERAAQAAMQKDSEPEPEPEPPEGELEAEPKGEPVPDALALLGIGGEPEPSSATSESSSDSDDGPAFFG